VIERAIERDARSQRNCGLSHCGVLTLSDNLRLIVVAGRFFFGSRCPKRIASIEEEIDDLRPTHGPLSAPEGTSRNNAILRMEITRKYGEGASHDERPHQDEAPRDAFNTGAGTGTGTGIHIGGPMAAVIRHVGRQKPISTSPLPPISPCPPLTVKHKSSHAGVTPRQRVPQTPRSHRGRGRTADKNITLSSGSRGPHHISSSSASVSSSSLAGSLLSAFASMFSPSGGRVGRTEAMLQAAGEAAAGHAVTLGRSMAGASHAGAPSDGDGENTPMRMLSFGAGTAHGNGSVKDGGMLGGLRARASLDGTGSVGGRDGPIGGGSSSGVPVVDLSCGPTGQKGPTVVSDGQGQGQGQGQGEGEGGGAVGVRIGGGCA